MRQLDRELRERVGDAERLRDDLQRAGVDVRELDRIAGRMRDLAAPLARGDRRALSALETGVVQGLKEFEFALRRQFAEAGNERPFLTGADEVPEKYRKLVEQYYKTLSRKPQP